jgi:alpha,alpha-trehalase
VIPNQWKPKLRIATCLPRRTVPPLRRRPGLRAFAPGVFALKEKIINREFPFDTAPLWPKVLHEACSPHFIVLGLLQDDRTDLARGMADNLLYEVQYYGKIPNANRTYYLTRSQPPFLTSIIRAVYESHKTDKAWLASALETALKEYQNVWLGPDRLVKIGGYELSRYYDEGSGPCPEVEPGAYDEKIQPWLNAWERQRSVGESRNRQPLTSYRFLNEYLYCGTAADLSVDGQTLGQFFKHDRALRESGHDTTHRFDDRTADFVSVDLNSLLYKYETDFADLIETEFGGDLPSLGDPFRGPKFWRQRAAARMAAMQALMWDETRGYFSVTIM